MRIGELAALAGVSTRTVRHYHHLGVLPEPERAANGYRRYRLRDAVTLARIRRLAELGLSLPEIRDVLADDRGRDLREVLEELDSDLARQQDVIAVRRTRVAALLAEAERDPDLAVSPDLSPGMAAVLRDLPATGSRFADLDRELFTLADAMATPADRERLLALLRPFTESEVLPRVHALYRRLDELADADADDPRVAAAAADLAAHLPDEIAEEMARHLPEDADGGWPGGAEAGRNGWLAALYAELSPAQTEVLRLMTTTLRERTRGSRPTEETPN